MQADRLDVMAAPAQETDAPSLHVGRPVKSLVPPEEWHARVELAALYRLVAHFRWTDSIYNHISMRVPGTEEHFLINPFGYLYEEITASSLVKVSVEGDVIHDPTGIGVNRAGFIIHGAVHAARRDVGCILHTHTRAGSGVSVQEGGLLPISQHAAVVLPQVAYHDAEGIAVRADEQARLVENLGTRSILILRNHGTLVAGKNAGEAFYLTHMFERACEIQIAALSGGVPIRLLDDFALAETRNVVTAANGDWSRDWNAMLRLLDRVAPDYMN